MPTLKKKKKCKLNVCCTVLLFCNILVSYVQIKINVMVTIILQYISLVINEVIVNNSI